MRGPNINCSIRGIGATVYPPFGASWDFSATVGFVLARSSFTKQEKKAGSASTAHGMLFAIDSSKRHNTSSSTLELRHADLFSRYTCGNGIFPGTPRGWLQERFIRFLWFALRPFLQSIFSPAEYGS